QQCPQYFGKGEPDLWPYRYLVDAVELVFDRILDREYFLLSRIEPGQAGVERRRLAASRRAGDQDDPLRPVKQREVALKGVHAKAKSRKILGEARPVENAQRHRFAMQRRYGSDTEIVVFAAYGDADTPVLRQAALGNVELCHDLYARDNCLPERLRW